MEERRRGVEGEGRGDGGEGRGVGGEVKPERVIGKMEKNKGMTFEFE